MAITATIPSSSKSRRRRSTNSYVRLEANKKAEERSNYITAGILSIIMIVLLASLGVIAFGMAG